MVVFFSDRMIEAQVSIAEGAANEGWTLAQFVRAISNDVRWETCFHRSQETLTGVVYMTHFSPTYESERAS